MALVCLIHHLAPVAVVLLIFCCCCSIHPGVAVDTLRQGGPALPPGSNSSLDSPSGQFSLAITEFNSDNLTCRYLGLWWEFRYFIWTVDGSFRICDGSGRLVLDRNGTLKLTHSAAGPPLVLYSNNNNTTSKNLTAAVQDNGSLAVRDGKLDPLWQSFDSPTDSWLPGMKLGVVNTGQNRKLTSWLVDSLPVKGAFTLEWDPKREELVTKRRGVLYWASGKQLGPDRFQHLDLTGISSAGLDYNVTRVSKGGDDYLTFGVSVNGNSVPGQWNFSILALGHDGGIEDKTVGVPALDPDLCDGNSTENGCVRWEGPECRRSNEERFYLPRWDEMLEEWDEEVDGAANGSVVVGSISDCKEWCWNHCQCGGVSLERAGNGTTQCVFYKYGVSSNESSGVPRANMYRQIKGKVPRKYDSGGNGSTNAPSISPSAAPSAVDPPPAKAKVKNSSGKWVKKSGKWVLVGIALALMILLILTTFWYTRRRKLRELVTAVRDEGNGGHDHLTVYSVAAIMMATDNFSPQNKLGQGGFGPVYKGKLPNGLEVAVKRLSETSGQGLVEFRNELILIAKLQHRNLVKLLGYCIHGEEKMLVYEYMANKSLDSFIFDESKRSQLDWNERFNIIEGIAQGLLYLHKYSRVRIIHRDLKVSNILLDEKINPKISDFGLARIFYTNASKANTNRPAGTFGYMSPEYIMEGVFSTKSDVFSFGIMLLEIVSGRKNYRLIQQDPPINLVGYAWKLWEEGTPLQLMDPFLSNIDNYKDQILRCVTVGLLCIEYKAEDRPSMSEAISMLNNQVASLPIPKQPGFTTRPGSIGSERRNLPEKCSDNEVTLTTMCAR
ncbi:unnamed protein product [Linum trigynum]|uniref:Receptor-like serine/threonine-protein kinase n=1 Tax=Linum trigynum TaxID=586398 RepID=A0AAV2EZP3_9ROSI